MSIDYVKRKNLTLRSAMLGREVFIDEIADLTPDEITRLVAEANAAIEEGRDEQQDYPDDHPSNYGRRHRMMIWRAYRSQCQIETELRGKKL